MSTANAGQRSHEASLYREMRGTQADSVARRRIRRKRTDWRLRRGLTTKHSCGRMDMAAQGCMESLRVTKVLQMTTSLFGRATFCTFPKLAKTSSPSHARRWRSSERPLQASEGETYERRSQTGITASRVCSQRKADNEGQCLESAHRAATPFHKQLNYGRQQSQTSDTKMKQQAFKSEMGDKWAASRFYSLHTNPRRRSHHPGSACFTKGGKSQSQKRVSIQNGDKSETHGRDQCQMCITAPRACSLFTKGATGETTIPDKRHSLQGLLTLETKWRQRLRQVP